MSAKGDEEQPDQGASVSEAFRQIAEHYVEMANEALKDDPDLCIDVPEPRLSDINPHDRPGLDTSTSGGP